jgi:hypothetical protein
MISIVYSTREHKPDFQKQIKENIGVKDFEIIEFINNGDKSLTQIYNEGLNKSKNNIVIFCHDDIIFDTNNWGRKLLKHFDRNPEYGILGIAGTTDLIDGRWWTIKDSMTGIVNHKHDNKKWTNKYSEEQNEKIKDVIVVDGLFFVVQKDKLKHNFDEDFKGFHFYDISFCFPNYLSGVKIAVITNIRITHLSIGMTNQEWEDNKKIFEEKYKNNLPIRLTNNKTFEEKLIFDKSTVGVGMVTYNAEHRIKQSAFTIPKWIENFVIVNDGTPYDKDSYPEHATIIQHQKNECVGKSKSDAIKWLMDKGCEHIFIIEDDILIKNENVFEEYIKHSLISGIKHLNFALHGPANKKGFGGFSTLEERAKLNDSGEPNPRMVVDYEMDIKIALYPNCVGAFSYYHKKVIDKVGLFDPVFKNAWEHVDHTYETHKKGFHPSFWYFADISNSSEYLTDIVGSIENSTIARSEQWNKNFKIGSEHYRRKHGIYPTQTPLVDKDTVNNQLQILYNNRI